MGLYQRADQADMKALSRFCRLNIRMCLYRLLYRLFQTLQIYILSQAEQERNIINRASRVGCALYKTEGEAQQKIFDCVAEVIGHREFGANSDIYKAGLTSIGAVKLNVLLSDAFEKAATVASLMPG